jgi:thymidylate synthase (FAD)
VKCPIFVARQWVRHRASSMNEYSARYSEMTDEFHVPEPEQLLPQSRSNKQGRAGELDSDDKEAMRQAIMEIHDTCYAAYLYLIGKTSEPPTDLLKFRLKLEEETLRRLREQRGSGLEVTDDMIESELAKIRIKTIRPGGPGLARELARIVMPVSAYTTFVWKCNLRMLFHFLALRCDSHAQWEIRQYADRMLDMVRPFVPIAHQAFLDYRLYAARLSADELKVVRTLLEQEPETADRAREMARDLMGRGRELNEFLSKLGL